MVAAITQALSRYAVCGASKASGRAALEGETETITRVICFREN